jgi:PHP family Zn ribbon phosphoesterase
VQWEPSRTRAASGLCPVCGKKLTIGVLHRVEELADRKENFVPPHARTYERMVPLAQVLGACLGTGPASKKVAEKYRLMLGALGPELSVLREVSISDIKACAGERIAEGIRRVRAGELQISAGYDGEYGKVRIFV